MGLLLVGTWRQCQRMLHLLLLGAGIRKSQDQFTLNFAFSSTRRNNRPLYHCSCVCTHVTAPFNPVPFSATHTHAHARTHTHSYRGCSHYQPYQPNRTSDSDRPSPLLTLSKMKISNLCIIKVRYASWCRRAHYVCTFMLCRATEAVLASLPTVGDSNPLSVFLSVLSVGTSYVCEIRKETGVQELVI